MIENLKLLKSSIVGEKHIRSILSGKDGSIVKTVTFNAIKTDLETYLISKIQMKLIYLENYLLMNGKVKKM